MCRKDSFCCARSSPPPCGGGLCVTPLARAGVYRACDRPRGSAKAKDATLHPASSLHSRWACRDSESSAGESADGCIHHLLEPTTLEAFPQVEAEAVAVVATAVMVSEDTDLHPGLRYVSDGSRGSSPARHVSDSSRGSCPAPDPG